MRHIPAAVLAFATLAAVGLAAASLTWRMEHDAPILFYVAYLIDAFDRIPYRSIFDMNLPGTYAAYGLMGRLTGYTDLGIRWVDVALLALLSGATYRALAAADRRGAWAGATLFALGYLGYGPRMSLQREFLVVVLAGLSLWALAGDARSVEAPLRPLRRLAAGLAIGAAITIKPHAGLLALPLIGDALGGARSGRVVRLAWLGAGLALPSLLALGYLLRVDALESFLTLARGYWPLYGQIGQDLALVAPEERWRYLLRGLVRFGAPHDATGYSALVRGHVGLLPAMAAGYFVARRTASGPGARRVVRVLAGYALCLLVYPLASGQFWDYHWLPFQWAALSLGGLALMNLRGPAISRAGALGVLALVVAGALSVDVPAPVRRTLRGEAPLPPKGGRPDAIAAYLRERPEPLGPVQVLDWTGGGIHALLLARVELATSFVYDFHFYHHPDSEFIGELRGRFLRELGESQPRYVIEIQGMKPNVRGPGTTDEFEQLRRYLETNYRGEYVGRGFRVLECRDCE